MKKLLKKATEDAIDEAVASQQVDFDSLTDETLLTLPQAASILNLPMDDLRYLLDHNRIKSTALAPGHRRIRYADLKQFLASIRVSAEDEEEEDV